MLLSEYFFEDPDDEQNNQDDGYGDDTEDGYGDDPVPPEEDGEEQQDEQDGEAQDDAGGDDGEDEDQGEGQQQGGFKGFIDSFLGRGKAQGTVQGKGNGKPSRAEMDKLAIQYKCAIAGTSGFRTKYKCPFCKQESIYTEPAISYLVRRSTWNIIHIGDRPVRYVCLNKNCKAFFKPGSPAARFFSVAGTNLLSTTHGLQTPTNPFSPRPQK